MLWCAVALSLLLHSCFTLQKCFVSLIVLSEKCQSKQFRIDIDNIKLFDNISYAVLLHYSHNSKLTQRNLFPAIPFDISSNLHQLFENFRNETLQHEPSNLQIFNLKIIIPTLRNSIFNLVIFQS